MDWFTAWLSTHINRHALVNLPDPFKAREMYDAWRVELTRLNVSYEQADAASLELMKRGKHYKSEHYAMLLAVLAERAGGVNGARADAELASRDCPYCQGSGRTAVVDGVWNATHAACCVCPSGRYYLAAWARHFRPLDLAHVIAGRKFSVARRGQLHEVTYRLASDPKEFEHEQHIRPGTDRRPSLDGRRHPRALPVLDPA